MDTVYSPEYEAQLAQAVQAALAARGADAAAIYALVTTTAKADVDYIPSGINNALLQGMHPDTIIDAAKGTTVLHELVSRTYPPPLVDPRGAEERSKDGASDDGGGSSGGAGVSIQQLLDRGATPNLQDARRNTALHLLLAGIASEQMFPDLNDSMAFQVRDLEDLFGDSDRVHYLDTVGRALLQAGWTLGVANIRGLTCAALLQRCRTRLESKGAKMVENARRMLGSAKAESMQKQLEHTRVVLSQLERFGDAAV